MKVTFAFTLANRLFPSRGTLRVNESVSNICCRLTSSGQCRQILKTRVLIYMFQIYRYLSALRMWHQMHELLQETTHFLQSLNFKDYLRKDCIYQMKET